MSVLLLALVLAGCIMPGPYEGGGTAVGNPGRVSVRSPLVVNEAQLVDGLFSVDRCHGKVSEAFLGDADLVDGYGPSLLGGQICGLTFKHGGISGDITEPAGQIRLDLEPFFVKNGEYIFELGEPGFDRIDGRSGLYRELVPDGILDPIERSQGALAAGLLRVDSERIPAEALLQVGTGGQRILRTAAEFPDYPSTDETGLDLVAAVFGDGVWMAVGGDSTSGVSSVSLDGGLSWVSTVHDNPLNAVSFYEGNFVATSLKGTIERYDGAWTTLPAPAAPYTGVAVSDLGIVAVAGLDAMFSVDGIIWQQNVLPGTIGDGAYAITAGADMFVAVGDGGYRTLSPDGIVWTEVSTGGGPLRSITWNGLEFAAVGDLESWHSPDANLWFSGPDRAMSTVVSHQGEYYGLTPTGEVHRSPALSVWTQVFAASESEFSGLGSSAP